MKKYRYICEKCKIYYVNVTKKCKICDSDLIYGCLNDKQEFHKISKHVNTN